MNTDKINSSFNESKGNDGFGQGPIDTIWTIGIGLCPIVFCKY